MSGKYARQHATALAKVQAKGSPLTFTLTTPGAEDIATGHRAAPATASVTGFAVRVRGKPLTYQRLALIESEAPTLEFVASTYGPRPALNSVVQFGGDDFTVADVDPLAPDGTAIISRVVVKR